MNHRFAVVGAGMQGTAAAYDLAQFGEASSLVIADFDGERARHSAERVNRLLGRNAVSAESLDVRHPANLARFMGMFDVVVSAVPYTLHELLESAALECGTSVVDMGIDTDMLMSLRVQSTVARAKGLSIVMDCGLAPGLINVIAQDLLDRVGGVREARLYCGGLPETPKPPLNYALRFSAEGLLGEYADAAYAIRNGRFECLAPLTELENVDLPDLPGLEAFVTSGGSSSVPFTHGDRIAEYSYKTLRYRGHCDAMRLLRDIGLWSTETVRVATADVSPREALCAVLERELKDDSPDLAIVLVEVTGETYGAPTKWTASMLERRDPESGFTAMERVTGFTTAIVAQMIAEGKVARAVLPCYEAVSLSDLLPQLARRGIQISISRSPG